SQMSPGCGLIEQVENLLFGGPRAHQIENVVVGEFNDLRYALPHLSRRFRLPLAQPCVQPLNQYVHGGILPHIQFSAAGPFGLQYPSSGASLARTSSITSVVQWPSFSARRLATAAVAAPRCRFI